MERGRNHHRLRDVSRLPLEDRPARAPVTRSQTTGLRAAGPVTRSRLYAAGKRSRSPGSDCKCPAAHSSKCRKQQQAAGPKHSQQKQADETGFGRRHTVVRRLARLLVEQPAQSKHHLPKVLAVLSDATADSELQELALHAAAAAVQVDVLSVVNAVSAGVGTIPVLLRLCQLSSKTAQRDAQVLISVLASAAPQVGPAAAGVVLSALLVNEQMGFKLLLHMMSDTASSLDIRCSALWSVWWYSLIPLVHPGPDSIAVTADWLAAMEQHSGLLVLLKALQHNVAMHPAAIGVLGIARAAPGKVADLLLGRQQQQRRAIQHLMRAISCITNNTAQQTLLSALLTVTWEAPAQQQELLVQLFLRQLSRQNVGVAQIILTIAMWPNAEVLLVPHIGVLLQQLLAAGAMQGTQGFQHILAHTVQHLARLPAAHDILLQKQGLLPMLLSAVTVCTAYEASLAAASTALSLCDLPAGRSALLSHIPALLAAAQPTVPADIAAVAMECLLELAAAPLPAPEGTEAEAPVEAVEPAVAAAAAGAAEDAHAAGLSADAAGAGIAGELEGVAAAGLPPVLAAWAAGPTGNVDAPGPAAEGEEQAAQDPEAAAAAAAAGGGVMAEAYSGHDAPWHLDHGDEQQHNEDAYNEHGSEYDNYDDSSNQPWGQPAAVYDPALAALLPHIDELLSIIQQHQQQHQDSLAAYHAVHVIQCLLPARGVAELLAEEQRLLLLLDVATEPGEVSQRAACALARITSLVPGSRHVLTSQNGKKLLYRTSNWRYEYEMEHGFLVPTDSTMNTLLWLTVAAARVEVVLDTVTELADLIYKAPKHTMAIFDALSHLTWFYEGAMALVYQWPYICEAVQYFINNAGWSADQVHDTACRLDDMHYALCSAVHDLEYKQIMAEGQLHHAGVQLAIMYKQLQQYPDNRKLQVSTLVLLKMVGDLNDMSIWRKLELDHLQRVWDKFPVAERTVADAMSRSGPFVPLAN